MQLSWLWKDPANDIKQSKDRMKNEEEDIEGLIPHTKIEIMFPPSLKLLRTQKKPNHFTSISFFSLSFPVLSTAVTIIVVSRCGKAVDPVFG